MKTYFVKMPITGYATINVEAESKEDATNKFFATANIHTDHNKSNVDEFVFEYTPHVCRGNVCLAELSDIEVELIDNEDGGEE